MASLNYLYVPDSKVELVNVSSDPLHGVGNVDALPHHHLVVVTATRWRLRNISKVSSMMYHMYHRHGQD